MLKEEVTQGALEKNLQLTASQLRRYVEYGVISTSKYSEGKGKGVQSIYLTNTIETLIEIENAKKLGFTSKDLIYFLFSRGYIVDFDKLKRSLMTNINALIKDIKFVIEIIQENREWITSEISIQHLPKKIPGRPSNKALDDFDEKKSKEWAKIDSVLTLMEETFNNGNINLETTRKFAMEYGYFAPKIINNEYPKKWLQTDKWVQIISGASLADFTEVQKTFNFFDMYYKFYKEEGSKSEFLNFYIAPIYRFYGNAGLNNIFNDHMLIKLAFTLLLCEPKWRTYINYLLSWNGLVQNKEQLKENLPKLLNLLDSQWKGGEIKNV